MSVFYVPSLTDFYKTMEKANMHMDFFHYHTCPFTEYELTSKAGQYVDYINLSIFFYPLRLNLWNIKKKEKITYALLGF